MGSLTDTIGAFGTGETAGAWMSDGPDLEALARGGEWLRPGQAAQLLGTSRATLSRRLEDGTIGWRYNASGKQRLCDPRDLIKLLEQSREDRRGSMPDW